MRNMVAKTGIRGIIPVGMLVIVISTASAYAAEAGESSLARVMDRFHSRFDVYSDAHAAGNHFVMRARMSSKGDEEAVPSMNEACADNPRSGTTCIRASFDSKVANWGGWYFMNGVLQGKETEPRANWGDVRNAGVDLRGAKRLSFWTRGSKGGERVEFFCLGVGRNPFTGRPVERFPGSAPKASTGFVTLTTQWKRHTIDLRGKALGYVLGGFAWVTNAPRNDRRDITFYIDDIRYDKARLGEPRFLLSYETIRSKHDFDVVLRNVAFTYDNALALLAFLASGDKRRAKLIADALVYAQQHDRFYTDGRIRNAYQAGDLTLPPGWRPRGKTGTVRMPGWYDTKKQAWLEDSFQVGTHTGNIAWAMLALLAFYETDGGQPYLDAAERMGLWVERHCRDGRGAGGYTAGFEGWEPAPSKLMHKATEHNLDLYAAFLRLHKISTKEEWRDRADHAKKFVLAMWDTEDSKFWTGTLEDGVTINKKVVPLDVQAWSVLALGEEGKNYRKALEYTERHMRVGKGFDFNRDRDGIWYEGTAQMAAAYWRTRQESKARALVELLKSVRNESGLIPAASKDGLTTGFDLPNGEPWCYFRRGHVGAEAWMILAQKRVNPFWFPGRH